MNKKYIIGGFIIIVFFSVMGYLLTESSVSYENDFSKVKQSDKKIRATGAWVKEKSYKYSKENNLYSFYLVDNNGVELKVEYSGTFPNNFESSTSVVVTGKFQEGIFKADNILTKCPSKYEEQFEASSKET